MLVKVVIWLVIIGLIFFVYLAWYESHVLFMRLIEMIYDQTGDDYREVVNRDRFIEAMSEGGGSEWQRRIRNIVFTNKYNNHKSLKEQKQKVRRYTLLMFLSMFAIFLFGILLIFGTF